MEHGVLRAKTPAGPVGMALGLLAATMLGNAALAAGHLASSTTDTQGLVSLGDFSPTGSVSRLTRFDDGVTVVVEASGLEPGNAYTLWWVVFNNPAGCMTAPCGIEDILNPDGSLNFGGIVDAQIGMGHATGNIARSDGTTEFGGTLLQNDNEGHQAVFGAGFGEFLLTVAGTDAEIHVVIQDHGKARGGNPLSQQLSLFEANCTPGCQDVQATIHLALP
jgi:hypothetical protein